ncbi:MAG: hypothetical protein AB1486_34820 [Planctomycetota bacterium]
MRVNPNLPPDEMRTRMRRAHRFEDKRKFEVASYLKLIEEGRYFKGYGFSSVTHLAGADIALTPRQTRERIHVASAVENLPKTRRILEGGKLSYSAVRTIARIATAATETQWHRVSFSGPLLKTRCTGSSVWSRLRRMAPCL